MLKFTVTCHYGKSSFEGLVRGIFPRPEDQIAAPQPIAPTENIYYEISLGMITTAGCCWLTQRYDQRTFDETVCDALITNKVQNICDGGAIKHGSNFSFVCDSGHTVNPFELFAMRQNNRNGSHVNVCAIYGIQFAPMKRLPLGSAT